MDKKSNTSLVKPTAVWNKSLKFDFKPLFIALGKAVTHVVTLNTDELGNDAIEAGTSLGLKQTNEELAFNLIKRSIFDAALTLTKESLSYITCDSKRTSFLSTQLDQILDNISIKFDKDFFKKPGSLPFVKDISDAYAQWLCDIGVSPTAASSISNRLSPYFVYSLSTEWRKNIQDYKPLTEELDNPFSSAEEVVSGWNLYFSCLKKKIAENVFDEAFSLQQIYIPLNGFYVQGKNSEDTTIGKFGASETRVCIRLSTEIEAWLKANDKNDALRVLSGGPGSGKSSFTKILCSELAEKGIIKPIYIPLYLIDPTREISSEVELFVREEGILGFNPLDPSRSKENLLIVFDGLDELASQGKAAAQVARDFVQAVERMVERRNYGENPIFVLISGRELIVQENETEFRKPKQILNILPYYVSKNDRRNYHDPDGLLVIDLRINWWKKYGKLTGNSFDGVPEQLNIPQIDEITAQPLLNYLVALSFNRGKLNFAASLNLNMVYADLVAAVHERAYEKSKNYRPISHIVQNDFERVLEEIGLAAWHGSDGRSTSVHDIMRHCKQSGLESLLNSFREGAEAGVTKLLAAFFFRRNKEKVGDDAAFIFTHKSFGEYLTAARLVRGIDRIVIQINRRKENTDDGFDTSEALVHWLKLTGPALMTEYIQNFLLLEIQQMPKEKLNNWQEILSELMAIAIENSMPADKVGGLNFLESVQYDKNSSTALLIALNCCSRALNKINKLKFSTPTTFGSYLRRVCPQRNGPQSHILLSALSYSDYSGQCLDMADFFGANLSYTKWNKCGLNFVNFCSSKLMNSDFSNATLDWSRLTRSNLENSSFKGATMTEVNFDKTSLVGVDFSFSILKDTNFNNSNVFGCLFVETITTNAFLHKSSNFEKCDISNMVVQEKEKRFVNWLSRSPRVKDVIGVANIVNEEQHDDILLKRILRD